MFNVTFEIYTDESTEHGEAESSGFELENVTLREAYEFLRWNGHNCEASCSDVGQAGWLTFYNGANFRTGETINYALHMPDKLTASTRKRIARIFNAI
jgi:hypothetical protein